MFKLLIYLPLFLFILNSCGKDNASNSLKGDSLSSEVNLENTTRSIKLVSPKRISVYENQAGAVSLFAISKHSISYSIYGDDSKDFNLNKKSGIITFKVAPNYERKKIYTFIAKATDDKGNIDIQNIAINILNINENAPSSNNIKRVFFVSKIYYPGDTVEGDPSTPSYYDPRAPRAPNVTTPTPTQPTPGPANPTTPTQPVTPTQPDNNQNNNQEVEEKEEEEIDKIYIRDNSKNIVTDDITQMMWQDNNDVKAILMNWNEANIYCENISLGGYSDWRLPTLKELNSVTDNKKSDTSVSNVFRNIIARNYWSSTKYAPDGNNAWTTNLYHGNAYGSYKSSHYNVACARDI